ncbi:unnamed protein product [Echinostoma caproni]|uniref:Nuclear pore complex protein Nup93 n=1 Tax=Echinostoma caproni TaxID=27848 RepID=A0A183AZI3_9TREM|nr:unnamed protein product [Echinostoma caproni]
MEEFLLRNLFLFALRKGYIQGAEAVLRLYDHTSYRPPALAEWCLFAVRELTSATSQEGNTADPDNLTPTTEEQRSRLEALLDMAIEFIEQIDPSNQYYNPLNEFIEKARRLVSKLKGRFLVRFNYYSIFRTLSLINLSYCDGA